MRGIIGLFLILLVLSVLDHTSTQPMMLQGSAVNVTRYSGQLEGTDPESLLEIRPPDRYLKNDVVVVLFGDDAVTETCGKGPLACAIIQDKIGIIAIADPCDYPTEYYATVLCHEKGHTLGWPAIHGA